MFKLIFLGFHQRTVEQLAGTKLTGQMDSAMCKSVLILNVKSERVITRLYRLM